MAFIYESYMSHIYRKFEQLSHISLTSFSTFILFNVMIIEMQHILFMLRPLITNKSLICFEKFFIQGQPNVI